MDAQNWSDRYAQQDTPWDVGAPHPELVRRLAVDRLKLRTLGHGARAFVPGCGRGHDALALAQAGWIVTAVDCVADLADEVGERLAPYESRFLNRDALGLIIEPRFELMFDHTFFCALPPDKRREWGRMARRLVGFRGRVMCLVFPVDKPLEHGGPPWRSTVEDLQEALGEDHFRLRLHEPVQDGVARRDWREEWAVFERLDS